MLSLSQDQSVDQSNRNKFRKVSMFSIRLVVILNMHELILHLVLNDHYT